MSGFTDAFQHGPCFLQPIRILNRFTKDMHFMDDLLPMTVYDFIICTFMVTGGTLIVFFVNPWVILRYACTLQRHVFRDNVCSALRAKLAHMCPRRAALILLYLKPSAMNGSNQNRHRTEGVPHFFRAAYVPLFSFVAYWRFVFVAIDFGILPFSYSDLRSCCCSVCSCPLLARPV